MQSKQLPLILIYYRFRGVTQPIRNLFCYMNLFYIEIHLDHFEQQKKSLPAHILAYLSKFKINIPQLPAIIHEDSYIENVYPIIIYTIRKFQRIDLMGSNIFVRSHLKQIFQIYFTKQPQAIGQVLKLTEMAMDYSDDEIRNKSISVFENMMDNSKYMRQVCQYLDRQQNPTYVLGELTLIDFFFFQTCQYILGMFDRQNRVKYYSASLAIQQTSNFPNKANAYYLKVMRQFQKKMKNMPFFRQNSGYLDSFSMLPYFQTKAWVEGIKIMWLGNPTFIA